MMLDDASTTVLDDQNLWCPGCEPGEPPWGTNQEFNQECQEWRYQFIRVENLYTTSSSIAVVEEFWIVRPQFVALPDYPFWPPPKRQKMESQ